MHAEKGGFDLLPGVERREGGAAGRGGWSGDGSGGPDELGGWVGDGRLLPGLALGVQDGDDLEGGEEEREEGGGDGEVRHESQAGEDFVVDPERQKRGGGSCNRSCGRWRGRGTSAGGGSFKCDRGGSGGSPNRCFGGSASDIFGVVDGLDHDIDAHASRDN